MSTDTSLFNAMDSALPNELPVGSIICYGLSSPPPGWLLCDGGNISQEEYPDLHALIGGRLPDLRSRFVVGTGGAPGLTTYQQNDQGGAEQITLAEAEMPSHQHFGLGSTETRWRFGIRQTNGVQPVTGYGGATKILDGTSFVGQNQSHDNLPPYWALAFIIKC